MSDELPDGWASIQVGEIFSVHGGGTPDRATAAYWDGDIPWLSSGDIKATTVSESSETITKRGLQESAARMCRKGSVLVVVRSGILKHTLPVAVLKRDASINQDIKAFDCGVDELNAWLALAWRASARALLTENREGTTVQSVTLDTLRDFALPIPPLAEQRRIVEKLEKLLAKVDACQQRLAKIPVLLKRFRQSVLAAACSGRLTADWRAQRIVELDITWKDVELRDICASITDGDHLPPPKQPRGIPFLTIGNISGGRLDFSETRFVSDSYFGQIKSDRIPRPGDVLYTVVGATIGIPVLVDVDRPFCFQRHIAILKPSARTTSKFLRTLLASPKVFGEAWNRITGSAQPTLPLGNLRTIPVKIPPLAEQHEIVRRVEALFAFADRIEARFAQAKARIDRLTPALLAKAFRGELVPQDPKDEPASVLLDRIRAARAGASASPSRKFGRRASTQLVPSPASFSRDYIRAVFAAEFVDRMHAHRSFGQVKLQKMLFLGEYHARIVELESRYSRYERGPHDPQLIREVEAKLKACEWFEEYQRSADNNAHAYRPLARAGGHRAAFEQLWPEQGKAIRRLVDTMLTWDTGRCERVATLYAAWNDLLIWKEPATDARILHEVLQRWHPAKLGIPKPRWQEALDWMRNNDLAPTGFGRATAESQQAELFSIG